MRRFFSRAVPVSNRFASTDFYKIARIIQSQDFEGAKSHIAQVDLASPAHAGLLHYAVQAAGSQEGREFLRYMLNRGALINQSFSQMPTGPTPLLLATTVGVPEVVDLLLNAGADPNKVSSIGNKVVDLLLNADVDPNGKDDSSQTILPLHKAALRRNIRILERLLQHPGIQVDGRSASGETPLHLACWREHVAGMRLLLEHGADPRAQSNCGHMPLDLIRGSKELSDAFDAFKELKVGALHCEFRGLEHGFTGLSIRG